MRSVYLPLYMREFFTELSLQTAMDIDAGCVQCVVVCNTVASDVRCRPYAQGEAAFPASAPMPNRAQVQEQEVAALAQVLRDANARICALEEVAIIRDGRLDSIQVSLQDARPTGSSMTAQLHDQTEMIAALEEKASTLQACVTVRDAEIVALNDRLRLVQRELDQSKRESVAQVKVSERAIRYSAELLFLTCLYCSSVCARLVYVVTC